MFIQHNMASLNANRQLGLTNKAKNQAMERLNSGYRINRAADDASGMAISEKMRAQIRGLDRGAQNVEEGIQLTNVADGGLNEVYAIFQRQRELMVQAANDTNTDGDREAIEYEIEALEEELNRLFEQTEYNTIPIFKGKDTILSGPTVTNNPVGPTVLSQDTKTTGPYKSVVWLPKGSNPQDEHEEEVKVTKRYSSSYSEREEIDDPGEYGHASYKAQSIYDQSTTTTTVRSEKDVKYKSLGTDPKYTTLKTPGEMTGANGYINVKNVAGDLNLSCAMSQLGILIDDDTTNAQNTVLDCYKSGKATKSTVNSADLMTATTTFKLTDFPIEIDQVITLSSSRDSYTISYTVRNNDTVAHNIDLRLAFDTLNADRAHAVSTLDATPGASSLPYNLENETAKIAITASGVKESCLTDIGDLYKGFDKATYVNPTKTNITHTGVGLWWEQDSLAPGGSVSLGSVTYGPIDLKVEPFEKEVSSLDETKVELESDQIVTEWVYLPEYLDIQAGANAYQNIAVRLWDLDTEKLKCEVPINVSAFNANDSLVHLDRVIDKMSQIRAYYGAMSNRMGHAYDNNLNSSENLQASESKIRDANMADEMVKFSQRSIIEQAGQAMLAQTNQMTQGVLQLLR